MEAADFSKRRTHLFKSLARYMSVDKREAYLIGESLDLLPEMEMPFESAIQGALTAALDFTDIHSTIDVEISQKLRNGTKPELVMTLYNRIPQDTVLLQQTGLEVCRQAAQIMRDKNTIARYPEGYIELLNNYTARLLLAQNIEDARSNVETTIDFISNYYRSEPEQYFNHYVDTLESRAVIYAARGDSEKALKYREQALAILDKHNPNTNRRLARILNNQAGVLFSMQRWSEALRAGEKAVKAYRVMAPETTPKGGRRFDSGLQPWSEDCRPDLGYALLALSTYQNQLGDTDACDRSSAEALRIFEALHGSYPDQFSHHLARAHNNRAMSFSSRGLSAEAVQSLQESANLYADLVQRRFSSYAAEYVFVLKNLVKAKLMNSDRKGAAFSYQLLQTVQQKTGGKQDGHDPR
jgi:tetratricopeptide (TPR) repeat protein